MAKANLEPNPSESSSSTRRSLRIRTSVFNPSVALYELGDLDEPKALNEKVELAQSSNSIKADFNNDGHPVKRVKVDEMSSISAKPKSESPYKSKSDSASSFAVPPPLNWRLVYDKISDMRYSSTGCAKDAPVDTMGCDMAVEEEEGLEGEKNKRFSILISLMLSSQTKDLVTYTAVNNLRIALKSHGGTLSASALASASPSLILSAISKVGFYNRKAGYIQKAAVKCRDEYEGDVPKTVEELLELPGVGKKMAYLMLGSGWGLNLGIGVDVHVHRITNRLGWHQSPTKTPEETRLSLESWLPLELHPKINHMLVGFGQTICTAVKPKCSECSLSGSCGVGLGDMEQPLCPSANVTASKSTTTKTKTKIKRTTKTRETIQTRMTSNRKRKREEVQEIGSAKDAGSKDCELELESGLEVRYSNEAMRNMNKFRFLGAGREEDEGQGPSVKIELEEEPENI